jgi:D-alanyl-D-alanine carboxypeptidase
MKIINFFLIIFIIFILCSGIFIFIDIRQVNNTQNIKTNTEATINIKTVQKDSPEKLTGDDLLIQVNKQHCLPDYAPKDLVNISDYGILGDSGLQLRKIVIPDLISMIGAADKDGIELKVVSAYRSYQDQEKTYSSWVKQLGVQEANRQSAPPGCSQHQLGTAVDFNELDFAFANTPAGIWLAKNAWQYGWVISFPLNYEGITGYEYEPWHYRYIGVENALEMQKSGLILSQFLDTKNIF